MHTAGGYPLDLLICRSQAVVKRCGTRASLNSCMTNTHTHYHQKSEAAIAPCPDVPENTPAAEPSVSLLTTSQSQAFGAPCLGDFVPINESGFKWIIVKELRGFICRAGPWTWGHVHRMVLTRAFEQRYSEVFETQLRNISSAYRAQTPVMCVTS